MSRRQNLLRRLSICPFFAALPFLALANPEGPPVLKIDDPALASAVQKGNWTDALTQSKELLQKQPHSPHLVNALVNALTHLGNKEQAIAVLNQEILETHGEVQAFLIQKGRVLARLFLSNKAFEIFQDGMNSFEQKKFKVAREKFEKAILTEPTNSELMTRIGQCLLSEGDSSRSIHYLSSASKLSPHEPEIRLWLGRALFLQNRSSKKLNDAINELALAHQALQNSEVPALWLAEAIAASGQSSAAIQKLEAHIKANPLHLEVLQALAKMRLAGTSLTGVTDTAAVWNARKDLQLAQSRMDDYAQWLKTVSPLEFAMDPPKAAGELQAEIQKLQVQIDGKL